MNDDDRQYEIRDPVHGFVRFNRLERDIINHPAFQRLRRIRQLAWTDMIYPGAMHTRLEHSIGVMHVATRLFDTVCRRSRDLLRAEYDFSDDALGRQQQIVRLAGLLHDIGHTPFSHSGEDLLPIDVETGRRHTHEDYSAAILQHVLADVIDSDKRAVSLGITARDVALIFSDAPTKKTALVWKALLSGQMDADRMDYLLRDSHHAGVAYGRYDLERLSNTVEFCEDPEMGGHELGVGDDGIHAVESLLIARYLMFTQVYFHKTRAIYDYHLVQALRELLKSAGGHFPAPTEDGIKKFLDWDDWRVLGAIAGGGGGEHGVILRERHHHRCVHETAEASRPEEIELVEKLVIDLKGFEPVVVPAEKSWYQPKQNILVNVRNNASGSPRITPLSVCSSVVSGMAPINQRRLYVPRQYRDQAKAAIKRFSEKDYG